MAEALVRKWDLKKGERAVVVAEHPVEFLLLSTALARAGGIPLPLPEGLYPRAKEVVEAGGVTLALVNAPLLEKYAVLREALSSVERKAVVGWEDADGWESLFREAEKSSGFFLPYTLKPGSIALLVPRVEGDGRLRLVMVPNSSLFFPLRLLPAVRMLSTGSATLLAFSPGQPVGWAAAILGLFAGRETWVLDGGLTPTPGSGRFLLVTDSPSARGIPVNRFGDLALDGWVNLGSEVPAREEAGEGSAVALPLPVPPRRFVYVYDLEGSCSALAVRVGLTGSPARSGNAGSGKGGIVLPGNRVRLARGREGEVLLRGPSVFPGFWNDLEETFRRWEGGWLHTGVSASRRGPWIEVEVT